MVVIYVKWMNTTAIAKQTLTGEIVNFDDPASLTDSELYKLCQKYGLNAKKWLRQFAGLLPEVKERNLYKRRGCSSIYHFAAKLAGMNHELTDRIIRIGNNLGNKPALRKLFEKGKVGWSKLELIAYISTPETDGKWAKKVESMPYDALQVFVQEYKKRESEKSFKKLNNEENLFSTIAGTGNFTQQKEHDVNTKATPEECDQIYAIQQSDTDARWGKLILHLHPEIEFKLRMRKQQIEKHKRETLSWNEIFTEITKNWDTTSPMQRKIPKEKIIDWGAY